MKACGNFAFMYDIHKEVYDYLHRAESKARTDFIECGTSARRALELFVESVIRAKHLTQYIPSYLALYEKIDMLRNEDDMRNAGYLQSGQTFKEKPLLPEMETVKYLTEKGSEFTDNYYDYLRIFGNTCTHPDAKPKNPKITFTNVVKCLRGCYILLSRYYAARLTGKVSGFNEDLMPIGKYIVETASVPADSQRSKCVKEFLAYSMDHDGEPAHYYLLRQYNRTGANTNFVLRNQRCFTEASQNSPSSAPDGMVITEELTPRNSKDSSFYIVSYKFNRRPQPLSNALLHRLTMEQRVQMCGRLFHYLYKLHNSQTPIYHRMLSYESVYVCDFSGSWFPYIVKFDYAKIVKETPLETVYANAVEAKERIQIQVLNKYLPPEWEQIHEEQRSVDWAKVDVYSLGVLCADILTGRIENTVASLDDMEELGVPEKLIVALDDMMVESPEDRISMDELRKVFREEE